jgi:hypothetical protein
MRFCSCLFVLTLLALLAGCRHRSTTKAHLPSKEYHFIKIDTSLLTHRQAVYVPVYSHIYGEDGNKALYLTTTLSIRNISFRDSFYVTSVVYYGSQGEVLKRYLDATLLVKPLSSVEFVVERSESAGGAGANFIVNWATAAPPANEPLIQSVMTEAAFGQSFVSPGVVIKP